MNTEDQKEPLPQEAQEGDAGAADQAMAEESAPLAQEDASAAGEAPAAGEVSSAGDEGGSAAPAKAGASPAPQESAPQATAKKKGSAFLTFLLFLLVACLGFGAYAWNEANIFLAGAPETPGRQVIVDIRQGMTLQQISAMLEEKHAVTSGKYFSLLARYREKDRHLQKGRFLVNTGWGPEKVLEMLASGKAMLYRLTLREGLAWWEVADALEKQGFCKAADFTSVIFDPEFLRHWGIPFGSAEGFLFPETYLLPRPEELNIDAARAVANRLVETFWSRAGKIWQDKKPDAQRLKELVTLASIVEKETGVPEERARVAGVYANRLSRGMLLQADPTVIYGMGRNFSGPLLRRHLDDPQNKYNTYQNPGLPPGPICSFGAASLAAAFSPEQHDFLYFVATGTDRGHTFSKTLDEHNAAVRSYRSAVRKSR